MDIEAQNCRSLDTVCQQKSLQDLAVEAVATCGRPLEGNGVLSSL